MRAWLSREAIVAPPDFNRWLVPPAALAVHLCIGMAYGFSVFWLPLARAVGVDAPIECPAELSLWRRLWVRDCDWKVSDLGWVFTLFFICLGSAAALLGHWLETAGPRKAGVIAAWCWGGGFFISALGVHWHQLWLLWLGAGVIGGCGLGLGYISPVSTLIKWFPDRRGLATGLAIMGFGGGAMVGAPLADQLLKHYAGSDTVGATETFLTLGAGYLLVMLAGSLGYRIPPPGWAPAGWTPPERVRRQGMTLRHVHLRDAHKTPQFWLLWAVLCLNVSAGIGVIGMASPMLQEIFGGRLIGLDRPLAALTAADQALVASVGAGFAGLLSLFNSGGRLLWASLSDLIGRKPTYTLFFLGGMVLYGLAPVLAGRNWVGAFVATVCLIVSFYGGGFATIPAYLADRFGTAYVGAIHGRLLTAWSVAGIVGPGLVNYLREQQIDAGATPAAAYQTILYVLAGLLFGGLLCNLAVRPVAERYYLPPGEVESAYAHGHPEEAEWEAEAEGQ